MARLFSKRTDKAGKAGRVRDETRHLVRLLHDHAIDTVFDVGTNTGQYGSALRAAGYARSIVSFEPVTSAHATLGGSSLRAWRLAQASATSPSMWPTTAT